MTATINAQVSANGSKTINIAFGETNVIKLTGDNRSCKVELLSTKTYITEEEILINIILKKIDFFLSKCEIKDWQYSGVFTAKAGINKTAKALKEKLTELYNEMTEDSIL